MTAPAPKPMSDERLALMRPTWSAIVPELLADRDFHHARAERAEDEADKLLADLDRLRAQAASAEARARAAHWRVRGLPKHNAACEIKGCTHRAEQVFTMTAGAGIGRGLIQYLCNRHAISKRVRDHRRTMCESGEAR